jgi:hypothetical protein
LGLPFPINQNSISEGELNTDQSIFPEDWLEDMKISDLLLNGNFSVNLGAIYQLNKWNFSASLLNIGVASWKRNGYRIVENDDVIRVYEENVKIGIPSKIYLGASRQFSPRLIERPDYEVCFKIKRAATFMLQLFNFSWAQLGLNQ